MGNQKSSSPAGSDRASNVASSPSSDGFQERRRSSRIRSGADGASKEVPGKGSSEDKAEPEESNGSTTRRVSRQTLKTLNKTANSVIKCACGQLFKNTQGLGSHKKSCAAARAAISAKGRKGGVVMSSRPPNPLPGRRTTDQKNKQYEEKSSRKRKTEDCRDGESPKHHHRKHRHHDHHLNEETLQRIKEYLVSDKMSEALDEDAIAIKMLRTDRATSERVKFLHDPYADSDVEEGEPPTQSYQAAEDYTLALDFYKRAVAETQAENPDKVLDKRTLYWLRKALGLHRRNDLWETTGHEQEQTDDESEGEAGSQAKNRRTVTRGMVRSTRIKRRQERSTMESMNLNALMSAVEELEGELGPFVIAPPTQKKSTKQDKRAREKDSSDEDKSKENTSTKQISSRNQRPLEKRRSPFDRDLVARLPDQRKEISKSGRPVRQVNLTERFVKVRLVVCGKDVKEKTNLIRARPKIAQKKGKRTKSPPVDVTERRQGEAVVSRKRRHTDSTTFERSMDLNSIDLAEESGHISLGLLEWKRRQLDPSDRLQGEIGQQEPSEVSKRLAKGGLSADLPPWAAVNFIPALQTQPIVADPPRRRHSDEQYARWIARMIDCLSGSGRNWALHEFFYSDIDRAWFNFDQFQVDVARLGVPPNARLTRKEWSLVRRNLRKRPRRFSRAFIKSELAKLCQYRDIVRAIQRSETPLPDFGFDVPRYVRVGATVTAIHWKRRLIHRGIVLGHDPQRNGYLVQFERQELGFQFCPDYEVASHGVPELLVRASDTNLEGANLGAFSDRNARIGVLPYGTSYGPMYVDQMDPVRRDKTNKIAVLDAAVANIKNPGELRRREPSEMNRFPDSNTLVERVAERQTLVELVATIDKALTRKSHILDAIDKCNRDVSSFREKHGPDFMRFMRSSSYMAHYSWLQANLRATNQTLESSLVLLQVMYGKAYTGLCREEVAEEKERNLESKLRRLCQVDEVNPRVAFPWSHLMAFGSDMVGSLVTSPYPRSSCVYPSEEEKLKAEYLNHSLSAATRVLLNANYCRALVQNEGADLVGDNGQRLTLGVAPMKACLDREVRNVAPQAMPPSSGTEPNIDKLHRAEAMRMSAMKELQDSMNSYEAELTATHLSRKILRS